MDLFDQLERENFYSVSEINLEIKELLETAIPSVWVQGEISNYVHHSSGHKYFSLKDANSQISCVMWKTRTNSIFFTPTDGMKVIVFGPVRVYEKRGTYQIDVIKMIPAGIGELQIAFEQLKKRLHEEGLFNSEFKKEIPEFPETIGIVTSPTGAAIQDIMNVLGRRYPVAKIILRPAKVQGEGAAVDIANAITEFNEYGHVDVLIIGRGGGTLEDLWAFNEEVVARAIFTSKIPIISAVGHEIDFTISDFVADLRAPTPSAAAELAVPDISEIMSGIYGLNQLCRKYVDQLISEKRQQLAYIKNGYGFKRPVDIIYQYRQRLDEILHLSFLSCEHRVNGEKRRIQHLKQFLEGMNPQSILNRGFSICRKKDIGSILKKPDQVIPGEEINIQMAGGFIDSVVSVINPQKKDLI